MNNDELIDPEIIKGLEMIKKLDLMLARKTNVSILLILKNLLLIYSRKINTI